MKRSFLILILTLAAVFSGCSYQANKPVSPPLCRIVTQITVIRQEHDVSVQKRYTDDEKMQSILNYLRTIDPYGSPKEDPKAMGGNTIRIIVSHSDGSQQVYEQKADRFMTVDGGRWMCIDAEKAKALYQLIDDPEGELGGNI